MCKTMENSDSTTKDKKKEEGQQQPEVCSVALVTESMTTPQQDSGSSSEASPPAEQPQQEEQEQSPEGDDQQTTGVSPTDEQQQHQHQQEEQQNQQEEQQNQQKAQQHQQEELQQSPRGDDQQSKGVSWKNVQIREYCRCLGNNPATTHGPALSIGWMYNETGTFSLDDYEENRPARRETNQMLVPGTLRECILMEQADVTQRQIMEAVQENQAARHRRQMSVATQDFEEWHLVLESFQRKMRRWKTGVSKKKEEELMWEEAKTHAAELKKIHPTPEQKNCDSNPPSSMRSILSLS